MTESKKKQLLDAINHKPVEVPLMYRGEPPVNRRLADHFGLKDIENEWESLCQLLGADNYSDGETLGGFTTYFPKYTGPDFDALFEINRFYIWGIRPVEIEAGGNRDIVFSKNPPLWDKNQLDDLRDYNFPKIDWFDFSTYKNNTEQVVYGSEDEQEEIKAEDLKPSERYFLNASCLNSIFMTSIFMRGMDKMMMDLVANKRYAQTLIGNIGEFMVDFCKQNLASIGEAIDLYGIWDDFASQEGLMLSPDIWRKYYKPWDKKIIEAAKGHGLLVCFHICGNCREVMPDLIEMGVDMLDPVQTSAKDMGIEGLKKDFGADICFHGGLDIQSFLPNATPAQVREKVKYVKGLFEGEGGLIFGPAHYITNDTPTENILAIYR